MTVKLLYLYTTKIQREATKKLLDKNIPSSLHTREARTNCYKTKMPRAIFSSALTRRHAAISAWRDCRAFASFSCFTDEFNDCSSRRASCKIQTFSLTPFISFSVERERERGYNNSCLSFRIAIYIRKKLETTRLYCPRYYASLKMRRRCLTPCYTRELRNSG